MAPRTTKSTRRFAPRPSGVLFEATGRYSPYPTAERRCGGTFPFEIRYCNTYVARAVDSSQFEGNWAVWIGVLSVCPSTRRLYPNGCNVAAIRSTTARDSECITAEPGSKNPVSARLTVSPLES